MRKVWYHQIWIQNNLGFIVSDLIQSTNAVFIQAAYYLDKFLQSSNKAYIMNEKEMNIIELIF